MCIEREESSEGARKGVEPWYFSRPSSSNILNVIPGQIGVRCQNKYIFKKLPRIAQIMNFQGFPDRLMILW